GLEVHHGCGQSLQVLLLVRIARLASRHKVGEIPEDTDGSTPPCRASLLEQCGIVKCDRVADIHGIIRTLVLVHVTEELPSRWAFHLHIVAITPLGKGDMHELTHDCCHGMGDCYFSSDYMMTLACLSSLAIARARVRSIE